MYAMPQHRTRRTRMAQLSTVDCRTLARHRHRVAPSYTSRLNKYNDNNHQQHQPHQTDVSSADKNVITRTIVNCRPPAMTYVHCTTTEHGTGRRSHYGAIGRLVHELFMTTTKKLYCLIALLELQNVPLSS